MAQSRGELLATHTQFIDALGEGDIDAAYALMAREYRSRVPKEAFAADLEAFHDNQAYRHYAWTCDSLFLTQAEVCRVNSEGFWVGIGYRYVPEDGSWRCMGRGALYLD